MTSNGGSMPNDRTDDMPNHRTDDTTDETLADQKANLGVGRQAPLQK